MEDLDEKRKLQLQALQNLRNKRLDEAQKARISTPDRSVNLSSGSLDKDVLKASGGSMSADVSGGIQKIKTGTDVIDNRQVNKIGDIGEFTEKNMMRSVKGDLKNTFEDALKRGDTEMLAKLKQIASKIGSGAKVGLKALPIIGGVAAAALGGAEDASAGIPLLDSSESVGMSSSDENQMLSETEAKMDYEQSQARKDALAKLAKL